VISAASGFIGEREIAEFEKAGGLGERFGDDDTGEQTAGLEDEHDDDDVRQILAYFGERSVSFWHSHVFLNLLHTGRG
jgi:hypothetical protein